jgi:hypothetical protein
MKKAVKKFGSGAKKVSKHLTKYLYERDTIFSTLWVFVFIVALGSIPINFYFLNPLKLSMKDFDFNDLAYSKLGKGKLGSSKDSNFDKNIVIINIGDLDREGLAMLVDKTASYGPKVIGLDVWMEDAREPHKDSLMREVVSRTPNLVLASRFKGAKDKDEGEYHSNFFTPHAAGTEGYVNFFNEEFATLRIWNPTIKVKIDSLTKIRHYSFAYTLVKMYDSTVLEYLPSKKKEIINYTRRTNQYQIVEPNDLLMDMVDTAAIRGKIALLGYINTDPNNIDDKKFTPMNDKTYGKTVPDMNGIVVHANIISMVLAKNYIKKLPSWVIWLVAIFIGWLHMSFFIRYYLENHIWFHLVAKIAQLASAIFFTYVGIYLFDRYRIKLDMKLSLIVIVMAVDVIYFYEAWAVWMHRKFGYQTVFKPHHHGHGDDHGGHESGQEQHNEEHPEEGATKKDEESSH